MLAGAVVAGSAAAGAARPTGTTARADAAVSTTSRYVALTPTRVIDTRTGLGAPAALLVADSTTALQLTGGAVPAGATAVMLNLTVTRTSGPGWVQVVPTGGTIGATSTINVGAPNETIAVGVFAPLDSDGVVQVHTSITTDVVIDVAGYFEPAATSTSGRFVPLSPTRVLDTRLGLGWAGRVGAGRTAHFVLSGRSGVPSGGVSAVVLNVTAADPGGDGWVQVAPRPVTVGQSSNLNVSSRRTIANLVVVPLGTNGEIDLYTTTAVDLIADVMGYFTDGSGSISAAGLFVPVLPSRQLDTRDAVPSARLTTSGPPLTIDVSDVSTTMSAVTGTFVAAGADPDGWAQLSPAPIDTGAFSNLNTSGDRQDIANGVVTPVGAGGLLQASVFGAMHLVLDVTGWFTGTPITPQSTGTVVYALGDVSSCSDAVDTRIGSFLAGTDPSTKILMLGDNVYPDGSATDYANCFNPVFAPVKSRIAPVPGNHEYQTANAAGYFGYFGAAAGDPTKGYYSYDLGSWHIVALNSNCSKIGGCGPGSPQESWLRADLAAHPAACVAAVFHHPRFSSGYHNSSTLTQDLWQALYDANADLVLNGHDHDYERFAPQTPTGVGDTVRGIREFVVGTGAADKRSWGALAANSEVRNNDTHGVLELTLGATGYSWQFHDTDTGAAVDSGSSACH